MTSADGRTWMVDVIDTDYQRGTFILNLVDGSYESFIGSRVITGNGTVDTSTVELPAVSGMADVVAWNQGSDGGGGGNMEPYSRGASGRENQVQSRRKIVNGIVAYCKKGNLHAQAAIAVAGAMCVKGGGQHSGGSIGFCGIGSDTGTCSKGDQMER